MRKGSTHTPEVIALLRAQRLGVPHGHKTSNGARWHQSEEVKKRIGEANRTALKRFYATPEGVEARKRISEWAKVNVAGENNPFFGKKHSEEAKAKMTAATKALGWVGSKHPQWKGGVSRNKHTLTSPYYANWRSKVFERDNHTCQGCGERGGYLEAHHIKSWSRFPKLRFKVGNGLALCKKCHEKTDNYKNKQPKPCN